MNPVPFSNVQWCADARRYLTGPWLAGDDQVFPGYCRMHFNGQDYAQFLAVRKDEDDVSWLLVFEDLFPSGGADGDCEAFDTEAEAVARGQRVIAEMRDSFIPQPVVSDA